MRTALVMCALLVVAGCADNPPIRMVHPETGETATCGPYPRVGTGATGGALRERACVEDFRMQGFVRAP